MIQSSPPDVLRPLFEGAQQAMIILDSIATDGNGLVEDAQGEFNRYVQCIGRLSDAADDSDLPGLQDVYHWLREESLHHDTSGQLNDQTIALHHKTLELAMEYMASACDEQHARPLLEHLRLSQWQSPLEDDDVEMLMDMLASAELGETTAVVDTASTVVESANEDSGVIDVGEDVLTVLADEVRRISSVLNHQLETGAGQGPAGRDAASVFAAELEPFSQALAAAGLEGLSEVVFYLVDNLNQLAHGDTVLDEEQRALLGAWRPAMLAYLNEFDNPVACRGVTGYLSDCCWPAPLPEGDDEGLLELLALPRRVVKAPSPVARPDRVAEVDVSLALPGDANHSLLDALLEELAPQSAEFSAAVQKLVHGGGHLGDVKVAMRVAHTLKGAANTVGVSGVANLTHYLEDVLEALHEHNRLPADELAATLMQAADCLEAMTEALQGVGAPPDNAGETLQQVLDWANRIDVEGLEGISVAADEAPVDVKPEDDDESAGAVAAAGASRLAPELMDTLLRLVGESTIVNGQIQNRVHRLGEQSRAVRQQNELVQILLSQLDQLVNVKGRTAMATAVGAKADGEFDVLELEQHGELQSCLSRLEEAVSDSREMSDALSDHLYVLNELVAEQERLHKENQHAIYRSRMVAVKTIVPRLERAVRQACRLTDKAVDLAVEGAETLIDSQALSNLIEPLMHVLRNAVDHGIEPAAQRQDAGKAARGRIVVCFVRRGDLIEVSCKDDGAGLDTDRIRAVAEQKGLIQPGEALSEDEINQFILAPRFTTRDAATQVSGRGIGMDAVYAKVRDIKGTLSLHSRRGEGLKVVIHIPVSLLSVPAVLVRCGGQQFAISNYGVEQILHGSAGEYAYGDEGAELIYKDQRMALIHLGSLLGVKSRQQQPRPIVVVEQDVGPKKAVLVDEVIYSREIVVKSMGAYMPPLHGIVGVTILGDGSIAPVLDLPELLRADIYSFSGDEDVDVILEEAPPRALVVDDSLSARRALAEFVEDCGYEVQTAIDGMDALAMLHKQVPDVLFVDLEMPRMNGMELTRYVRVNSEMSGTPVIMVTSRASDKHRRQANAAGVDAFIAKPFNEDELQQCLNTLRRRGAGRL